MADVGSGRKTEDAQSDEILPEIDQSLALSLDSTSNIPC